MSWKRIKQIALVGSGVALTSFVTHKLTLSYALKEPLTSSDSSPSSPNQPLPPPTLPPPPPSSSPSSSSNPPNASPPDLSQLGRCTWLWLHTMAAAYPRHPTSQQQKDMDTLMRLFAQFYPCKICSEDFKEIMTRMPPRTENKQAFALWMCEAHNEVNRKLGKPDMSCTDVVQRWNYHHNGNDDDENDDEDCDMCDDILGKDRVKEIMSVLKQRKPAQNHQRSTPSTAKEEQQ